MSLISSVLIAFVSVFTLFFCDSGANRVEATPAWAIGDWVADNKKVFTLHSDGQTVYDIAGLSALSSNIPPYLYTKITKMDDENYSYSTFVLLYSLDVEPIYANSAKVVKGVEGEGDIRSGSDESTSED